MTATATFLETFFCKELLGHDTSVAVIEDDNIVRDLVVRALETRAYTVLPFEDAQPFLDTDNYELDLIITDLRMPTPGEKLIQVLREKGIKVPILAMTGDLTQERIDNLRTLGTTEVIEKPFMFEEFLDLVEKLVSA